MALGNKKLCQSRLLGRSDGDGEDPMSSMGNLMDVMMVFACGLIVALVAHYNVDLSPTDPLAGNAEHLDAELEQTKPGQIESESTYAEVGTVYRDVKTGELYVVAPEDAVDDQQEEDV